jgi:hypothetical protein
MSALGQKRTFAVQKVMSALPLIATVKADIAFEAIERTKHESLELSMRKARRENWLQLSLSF